MPGYGASAVYERVGLVCPHCKLLLRQAVQTDEGVRLCQSCFKEIACLPGYHCVNCDITVNPEKFYPDRAVQRDVMDVLVKCIHHTIGCPWTGQLKNWENHTDGCVFRTVKCPNKECEVVLPFNQLESHQQTCQFRRVTCEHCHTETSVSQQEPHFNDCPKRPVPCKLCQQQLNREKLEDHLLHQCRFEECCVCQQKVDRVTKQEIASLAIGSNKKEFLANSDLPTKHKGCPEEEDAPIPVHLEDTKDVFSHFQVLALQQRVANHDIEGVKAALKQAERDIAEGRDTILEFQLTQKKLQSNFEEQSRQLITLEGQIHLQGNGSRGKVVDKNICSRLEALEKSFEEKNRIIQKQSQQISDLMHTVDNLGPLGSKAFGPKHNFRDNYTASHGATGYEEERVDERVGQLEKRFEELAKQTTALKCHTQELEMQLQASLASTHNGSFLWRIPEVARRKRDAIEERITSIYSPPFYTGRNGYKMCIRAYLNGDGSGYKTHLSLFFVVMKGEYDALLKWPFDCKVSMILVDQDHRKHIVQTFKPTPESSSFQRPRSDMNVASGCPQFTKLSTLEENNYVKDDVMYIKCIVDTSRIFHP